MRIIWYSTAPNIGVGYGTLTYALVKRMQKDGHYVEVATKHNLGGQIEVDGIKCWDGREVGLVSQLVRTKQFDYVISAMDVWPLPEPFCNWVAVNFLDTELMFQRMIQILRGSKYQVAVTKHGYRELQRVGFNPIYAPLGVDTNLFKPNVELRESFRKSRGWSDDTFVIGLVGINYGTDRKNIIGLLRAFQGFNKRHPNSVVYLHTDIMGSATQGVPMLWVAGSCGFDDSGRGVVQWVNQEAYHKWDISQEELVRLYNSIDIMCLPSQGEGFGLPWIEAQSCGCPVISADTTSGRELNKTGWVIPTVEDDWNFSSNLTWYVRVPPSRIDEYLEKAYRAWETGKLQKMRKLARERILEYEWDNVYDKYWRPMLRTIENGMTTPNYLPNYGTGFYDKFSGRILMFDCGKVCDNIICNKEYPMLPGEWAGPTNILSRSFPIVPDREGKLLVDTSCTLYNNMSPRFIKECKNAWFELWGYPVVRKAIGKLWDDGAFSSKYIELQSSEHSFDEKYRKFMQTELFTTLQITDEILEYIKPRVERDSVLKPRVLDVGCGNGSRVDNFRSRNFDAVGCEVNSAWVDGDRIIYGDAENLPFKDNSFGVVLSVDVLEHLKNPIKGLKELFRVSNDSVIMQITPVEDVCFEEDPTHIVPWNRERWMREICEFGRIEKLLGGCGFIVSKGFERKLTKFTFNNKEYDYSDHSYNHARWNERSIEIPIFKDIISNNKDKSILELGNVLSHYGKVKHDVVDLTEKFKGVINQDIFDYSPDKKYDLIVSISTIEHIKDTDKLIKKLKSLLNSNGKVIFSVPLGYNKDLDNILKEDKIKFNDGHYFVRQSHDNIWGEVEKDVAWLNNHNHILCQVDKDANTVVLGRSAIVLFIGTIIKSK